MAGKKPTCVVVGGGYVGSLVAHDAKLAAVRALHACGCEWQQDALLVASCGTRPWRKGVLCPPVNAPHTCSLRPHCLISRVSRSPGF